MRLLNTETFELKEFEDKDVPQRYAILSHLWGNKEDEILFRDVENGKLKDKELRPTKIQGCCELANGSGFPWIWVDTCCIDNTDSVECVSRFAA